MANYTYTDNILFEINDDLGFIGLSSKYGNDGNSWDRINSGKQTTVKPFINAVEIDWNHAYVGTTYLDTTGESGCSILVPSNC